MGGIDSLPLLVGEGHIRQGPNTFQDGWKAPREDGVISIRHAIDAFMRCVLVPPRVVQCARLSSTSLGGASG